MREAFGALTLRGRCLLAAGLTTALSAFFIGEDDLLRVAVVIAVTPLLCVVYVALSKVKLTAEHQVSARQVPVDTPVEVSIVVRTGGNIPAGTLLCEDSVSPGLGTAPKVRLSGSLTRTGVRLHYTCTPSRRGRHQIGPLRLSVADPFGLTQVTHTSSTYTSVLGLPRIELVPPVWLNSGWASGGHAETRSLSGRGEDDFSIREHNPGDGMRKVHWRTSARMGKLMVRREEQLQEARAAVMIDDRRSAHRGEGQGSTFERAVEVTASISVALMQTGFNLRLFGSRGERHTDSDTWTAMSTMEHLALAQTQDRANLIEGIEGLRDAREDGLLVAVLGDVTAQEAALLAQNRTGHHASVAILLDVAGADELTEEPGQDLIEVRVRRRDVSQLLTSRGWKVIELANGEELAVAMASLGNSERSIRSAVLPEQVT